MSGLAARAAAWADAPSPNVAIKPAKQAQYVPRNEWKLA
jgi:hypothetical protein